MKRSPRTAKLNVSVRKALARDAGQISILNQQLGYPYARRLVKAKLKQLLRDTDHLILVATLPHGFVCGWVHAHVYRLFYADKMAEISGLVVGEKYRGLGIGKELMHRAERWAKAIRCKSVNLRTNIIRKDAHFFYEKLGYRKIKTQHTYRKRLH